MYSCREQTRGILGGGGRRVTKEPAEVSRRGRATPWTSATCYAITSSQSSRERRPFSPLESLTPHPPHLRRHHKQWLWVEHGK